MSAQNSVAPPAVVQELEAIFSVLPDAELLNALRGPKRRGRPGHDPKVLWRCFITRYVLGIESISALRRRLGDNPYIAQACGIKSPETMPSQPTLSRFGAKMAKRPFANMVRNVQRELTRRLYETLPGFGRTVAIDSTDLKGWSNPSKKGKKRSKVRRHPVKPGRISDTDAGWSVKTNTRGNKGYTWGFKAHIICDAHYELPIVVDTTPGNFHDVRKAGGMLMQARRVTGKFMPEYFLADAGYSSKALRHMLRRQFKAEPVIDPNPTHRRALKEWREEYNEIKKARTSVERLNARLKGFFALDHLRVRGNTKVKLHAHLSVMALQARALAFPEHLRQCVRSVA